MASVFRSSCGCLSVYLNWEGHSEECVTLRNGSQLVIYPPRDTTLIWFLHYKWADIVRDIRALDVGIGEVVERRG